MSIDEQKLIVKTASLYYHDEWTQAQISKKLGMSRPIVSRLLQKAKDTGIVEVFIKDETVHTVALEEQLEKHYGLAEAVVVPISHARGGSMKRAVAAAGAYYVAKKVKQVKTIGISWGTTVAELVKQYPLDNRPDLHVVPLEGGMGRQSADIHANHLAYELAKKTGASCSYLYAPAIVDSAAIKKDFMEMEDIKIVLKQGINVEMAVIGVGNPHLSSTLEQVGYLKAEDSASLKKAGAAGDVGFRFFDDNGKIIDHYFNDRVVGIPFEQLKKIPHVVAVADGTSKQRSVKALLASGTVNALIIDEPLALALLNESPFH